MKRLYAGLGAAIALIALHGDADQQGDRWKSVILWSNKTLTARVRFLPKASLADEDVLVIELDNQSGFTVDITQALLNVQAVRKNAATGRLVSSGEIGGAGLYGGKLAPGTIMLPQTTASPNLGLPPQDGYLVDITVQCEAHLSDGQVFSTPKEGVQFQLEWKYPTPAEIEEAKKRTKTLLANPEWKFDYAYGLTALLEIKEVADSLTVDELLSNLNSRRGSLDGRDLVVGMIAQRFTDDPKVVSYYLERISANDQTAMSDLYRNPKIWNPAWIEALVANYEEKGDFAALSVLGLHRKDWGADIAPAIAGVFIKNDPLLGKKPASLSGHELYEWGNHAAVAGMIGDKSLIPLLAPALDDTRVLERPMTAMDLPNSVSVYRICDKALSAILTILDGNAEAAFKQAGVDPESRDDKERFAAYDRVIALTKERLKKLGDGGGGVSTGK